MPPLKAATSESWQRFLHILDSDPGRAGASYQDLRRKLIRFFEMRQAVSPEDLADEVLDRLVAKLDSLPPGTAVASFAYGIARLVALEHGRQRARIEPIEEFHSYTESLTDRRSAAQECLERCLSATDQPSRTLVLEYYAEDKIAKAEARQELAHKLKLSVNALRIRAMRIRDKLEKCVHQCLEKK